jgi:hypothetical protein
MKTVIEMANEAGLEKVSSGWRAWTKDLAQFAELVRADAIADEREACAQLCAEDASGRDSGGYYAEIIRDRSNT